MSIRICIAEPYVLRATASGFVGLGGETGPHRNVTFKLVHTNLQLVARSFGISILERTFPPIYAVFSRLPSIFLTDYRSRSTKRSGSFVAVRFGFYAGGGEAVLAITSDN